MSKLVNNYDDVLDVCKENYELIRKAVKLADQAGGAVKMKNLLAAADLSHKYLKQQNNAVSYILKEDTNRAKFRNYESAFSE